VLGIGMQEILIILVVALIIIGPKRLPELAKTLGKGFAEFKKAADDLQETVRKDLETERHQDLKDRYPDLIPEDGDEERQAESSTEGPDKSPSPDAEKKPEETSPSESVNDTISYSPDEIEGGDFEDEDKDA
jgi:Tat protein translocase TatB subunit